MIHADPALDRVVGVVFWEHDEPRPWEVTRDSPTKCEDDIYALHEGRARPVLDVETFLSMNHKEESKHQVDTDNLERFSDDIAELH